MFITIWTLLQQHHIEETKVNFEENKYFSDLNPKDLDKLIMIYNGLNPIQYCNKKATNWLQS